MKHPAWRSAERQSLPVWEEWIEILSQDYNYYYKASLPVWEEWIEISEGGCTSSLRAVSSRMGRVD